MNLKIKKEEYTALGDFVFASFNRDLPQFEARFVKFNAGFRDVFGQKLNTCKTLNQTLNLVEAQKATTKNLYDQADAINKDLTIFNTYIADAGLNTTMVTALKADLKTRNIEGAVIKLAALSQFVTNNLAVLTSQGLQADYAQVLLGYRDSLELGNFNQTELIKNKKSLTSANLAEYEALYDMIKKVCEKGKLIFKDTPIAQEYTIQWNLSKMRAAQNTPPVTIPKA